MSFADSIYVGGKILTGEGLDSGHPVYVTALAIRGGKVAAAGTAEEIQKAWRGPNTEVVGLEGKFVVPGFNDAHAHLAEAGFTKLEIDLTGSVSLAEMQKRVARAAAGTPPGAWLRGRGWDHTLWPGKRLPSRTDLDAVTAGHPAVFARIDGHIAVANTAALKAAGIDRNSPDPPGGKFDRNESGELTGIARETATELIYSRIPPPTTEQRRKALELATEDAVCHGVTSVQDNSAWDDFLVMERMEREGVLRTRVTEWLPFDAPVDLLEKHRAAHPADDSLLHTGMLKGFLDGSLGSRTAALLAPYADEPGNSGISEYEQQKLNQMTIDRAKAGFQIGFHAIGDRAVRMGLNAFAAAESLGLGKELRFRIEHAQVVSPEDFERFRKLGVIASMQPNHLLTDMHWAEARLGPQREKTSYAWKFFLENGVPLAFGTDYPVEPVTPFRGIYAAVTRTDEAGHMNYHPEEKLNIYQALSAYTQGAAYAEFAETRKGKLLPGFDADFVVLDRDLTEISPPEILGTRVLRAIVAGKTACRAGGEGR